jgi:phosphoribosylformylglycinamidine synthase II
MGAPQVLEGEYLDTHKALALAQSMGLRDVEYHAIEKALGRAPTRTETAVFAGMWSEHCAYKSTRQWLKMLPKEGPGVLAGPGSHAGAVDVGEGWAVAFKIESHNHPSAVEPYQGAATGVGGILRDVIAQGARPCAVMDSLCLGMPSDPKSAHLAQGIVAGIAGYGHAFGVPNVGGHTVYDPRYEGNPLVNALAAGLVKHDAMRTAQAQGVGNAVLYVGAATGRDGVLGAAFASEELATDGVESRPHVQVGDPFAGKKLMEACLSFTPSMGMVACQDMGACGITCATTEMAAAGEVGMLVDLEAIPLREEGMTPQEILLSESQERFMFVVQKGFEDSALKHFRQAGVFASVCGRITEGTDVVIQHKGSVLVHLPAALVAGGSVLSDWPVAEALPEAKPFPVFEAGDVQADLCALLSTPGIGSVEHITHCYDQTVGNRTVRGPMQAEAAVLKLPQSTRGFALTITGRGEVCTSDPFKGAQAALAEGMRRLACVGAKMVAVTDGLNMASPRDPVENRRLYETVCGLREGLLALGVPVTGGNVSLYNESALGPVPPTPMVGSLGVVEHLAHVPHAGLGEEQHVFLLGDPASASENYAYYGRYKSGSWAGPSAHVDLAAEKRLALFLVNMVEQGRVACAKSVGIGGMAVALAKMCLRGGVGVRVQADAAMLNGKVLFAEPAATVWVGVEKSHKAAFEKAAEDAGVPCTHVGVAGGDVLSFEGCASWSLETLQRAYAQACVKGAA